MTTPDIEVMSMLRFHPQGCLETDKSDFIIKAIKKIKERSLVDVDLPICFVIGVAKHPRTHEKVLVVAMNGKRQKTHILKFYLVSSKMEMSVYCYFKLEEQFHGGVDINDFSLYTACFSDSLNGIVVLEMKYVPFTIVPFLPIKFENITADYLIDFFTYGIPAEIRCSKLKGLPPQQMEHYFQALFFFPISYDVKSIKEQPEICEIRLPLFGRLPTEKKERIRTPMERNIWEKEFKKCLNLIFLNSFSVEGQNLKGQEEFVRKYDELLNHCISHCYTNFDNYLKEKYKNQIGIEEEKHTYNLILEKIHFYACIEDCLHQFGLQARQRETVDALVIDAYHVLPFRVFTQCVLSGCLKISPMAYCSIVNSMPPTSQNSDLEKLFNWTLWKEIPINAKKPIKKEALYIRNECYVKYIKNSPPSLQESNFFETETDPEVLFRRSLFGYCIRTNTSSLSSDLPISSDVIQYLMK
ncbi:hypothetical protein EDI_308250 [Entamoeba dispar SAW760]|uniref:Uncharacterized protein n=1 Tax=Entamoeba dispar (strain ATCC PRA-260 / SAW760) TaxID=370354 RepID=B0ENZ4_ENTDS|nr:uncharacterized protein EDI_308250 [Entamoeba dispar SAW760]EDR23733.1 hypothetical protein EDI_308250 [Entamoeba dispar SAW760]|eukprot:EDR23733.1 hypothetical protein EDI_308250 [Entamoeba dispar SAW760]